MFRWFLLSLAGALATLSLLTVVPAPPWSPWKLAVLAGEFGHWLALLALAVAFSSACAGGSSSVLTVTTVVLATAATALFLVPAAQAWRLAARLPAQVAAEFGAGPPLPRAFSFSTLFFGRDPAPIVPQTFEVSPGLPLDFYAPVRPAGAAPAPVVIVIHGGGWDSGDRTQLPKLNHWLASRGYAVAAISYRLAPAHRWPAPREDVLAALAFLQARASALGIDPTRLVLLGRSAGGQIAETVAYTARDPALRGVVGFYAPSDLIFGYVNTHENDMLRSPALMRQYLGGPPDTARAQYESASAIFHVGRGSPPTLLLHGTNDALSWHRHSERLAAKLAEHRVPHLHVALPWATHAFDYNLHGPGGQLTCFALETFLARVTR
jgi:acetyl esterase/lipase